MSEEAIAENARRLVAARAAVLASGADTIRLDAAIDAEVSPLLPTVADEGAAAVEYVLGDLLSNPESSAQPRGGPGTGPESKGHPDGKVHPQTVAQPGGIGDRPGVAEPGTQRDSTPGAQRDSKHGAQSDKDAEPGAQSDGDAEPGAQSDGDAEPGAQRVRVADHTRPDSGPSHPDRSGPDVRESASPVLSAGAAPEAILTPVGWVNPN
jgi:hypothetical protein